jgi:peptidoglycan/xylan/chitin deacetylase (PgdA/CDA1 family)
LNTPLRSAVCAVYKYSGALFAQEALSRLRGHSFAAILLFHRVTDAIPPDGLTVGTARFRSMCAMLRRAFRVVPLAEVFRLAHNRRPIPRRTVAITFDDGYRDNHAAARVLAEHGLPATFFIPTGYVDSDRVAPWDRHLSRLDNLSWDDVREIARMGFEIGSHTVDHPDMARVSLDQARRELVESKRTLERKLGKPVRYFAYPFGGRDHFSPERLPLVNEAGYEGCVSAFGGFVRPEHHEAVLPRVAMPYFHSVLHLEVYLAGGLQGYYSLKQSLHGGELFASLERPEPAAPLAEMAVSR